MSLYLGIDPGSKGSLAVINDKMELVYLRSLIGVGDWSSEKEIAGYFDEIALSPNGVPQAACIEKVGGYIPKKGKMKHGGQPGSHMFNFGMSYGFLRACMLSLGIPVFDVPPATWQKRLDLEPKGDKSYYQHKKYLCNTARELFPGSAKRIKAENADSVLIAVYALHALCPTD